jgi:hypothetical protein
MEFWAVVVLAVIAASSVVQAVVTIGLARAGQRLGQRLEDLQQRLDRDLRPTLESLSRVSRNIAEISDLATRETRRAAEVVGEALGRLEGASDALQRFVMRPLGPLTSVLSLIRGLRQGIDVYRRLGSADRERRGRARRYEEDEHLFI